MHQPRNFEENRALNECYICSVLPLSNPVKIPISPLKGPLRGLCIYGSRPWQPASGYNPVERRCLQIILSFHRDYADKLTLVNLFLNTSFLPKQGLPSPFTGPGRCRKVEEKQKNDSVEIAGRNSATLKTHHKKSERFNEYQINEC